MVDRNTKVYLERYFKGELRGGPQYFPTKESAEEVRKELQKTYDHVCEGWEIKVRIEECES